MNIYHQIRKKLEASERKPINQREMGDRIGEDRHAINKYEWGKRQPNNDVNIAYWRIWVDLVGKRQALESVEEFLRRGNPE